MDQSLEAKLVTIKGFQEALLADLESDNCDFSFDIAELVELFKELTEKIKSQDIVEEIRDESLRSIAQRIYDKKIGISESVVSDEDVSFGWAHDDSMDLINEIINDRTPLDLLRTERGLPRLSNTPLIPDRARGLFNEARECVLLDKGNAAIALGRMLLEFTITDIGIRIGQLPDRKTLEQSYADYPPHKQANRILGTGTPRRTRFWEMYNEGSSVIHSSCDASIAGAGLYLARVCKFVEDEYSIHRNQLKPVSR